MLDEAGIRRQKMGCLLAVAAGSAEPPRFISLEYRGGKAGAAATTAGADASGALATGAGLAEAAVATARGACNTGWDATSVADGSGV